MSHKHRHPISRPLVTRLPEMAHSRRLRYLIRPVRLLRNQRHHLLLQSNQLRS
jgi:hypothetical protein